MKLKVKSVLTNEKGFTLMEMLVVLSIFLVVSTAILLFSHKPFLDYTEKQLMNQNELLIRMTQLISIEKENPHSFEIVNCRRIRIKERNKEGVIYEQMVPNHIEIFITTPNSRLIFNTEGNTNAFGRIMYHFENVSYQYSVNIGKARILEKEVFHDTGRPNACGNTFSSRHSIFPDFNNNSPYL
ncbi:MULTISPECIES: prepilin-type N-terminal cleavage/methylation domain-containing protein [Solibacillus]|uniref:Prepilin-type N-terminal cleavage/methylation domain-containing protein n=1 Tax=Solibacillus merdavium TaxID=2762218 RepID=A0ABR8XSZ7_9BACL|nr:prepilin-type N-terminal cleavage/methylation domain-containing protein [Solibacillus merdavium]